MVMKCSNHACKSENFKVTVEHRVSGKVMTAGRLPVKLVCAKCRKPVRAYITNEQMKEISKLLGMLFDSQARIVTIMATKPRKPWWKFW